MVILPLLFDTVFLSFRWVYFDPEACPGVVDESLIV